MYVLNKRAGGNVNQLMAKVVANAHPKYFSEFIERYGFSKIDLIHYLLKYTYVENWDSELSENYLSVHWEYLCNGCDIVYGSEYIQDWRRQQVKNDFGIDIGDYVYTTHKEVILKIRREK